MQTNTVNKILTWIVAIIFALVALVFAITPFFFMLLNSFKDKFEMLTKGVFALPDQLLFQNYQEVLEGDFLQFFFNSIIILVITLILLIAISAFAAYPLSRFNFKMNKVIYSLIVSLMAIPVHVTLIPIFRMTKSTGMYDSIWALIGPNVAMGIPISVFILTSFMKALPKEIEEAAEIDGCGKVEMFFRVILPMSKPGLSTLAIYNGVNIWNEFIFAYTLTQTPSNQPLPLAIWEFQGQYSMNIPLIMAVLTMTVMPMIILFILAQDKLVKGMTAGAVKG